MARRYSSGKYCKAPLLYAGAIFAALRRISLTVVSVSRALALPLVRMHEIFGGSRTRNPV